MVSLYFSYALFLSNNTFKSTNINNQLARASKFMNFIKYMKCTCNNAELLEVGLASYVSKLITVLHLKWWEWLYIH